MPRSWSLFAFLLLVSSTSLWRSRTAKCYQRPSLPSPEGKHLGSAAPARPRVPAGSGPGPLALTRSPIAASPGGEAAEPRPGPARSPRGAAAAANERPAQRPAGPAPPPSPAGSGGWLMSVIWLWHRWSRAGGTSRAEGTALRGAQRLGGGGQRRRPKMPPTLFQKLFNKKHGLISPARDARDDCVFR